MIEAFVKFMPSLTRNSRRIFPGAQVRDSLARSSQFAGIVPISVEITLSEESALPLSYRLRLTPLFKRLTLLSSA